MGLQFKRSSAAAALAILAVWAAPAAVAAEEGEYESSLAVCGHLDEMSAAREALAKGDRETALSHLRAARALLVECQDRIDERDLISARTAPVDSI